MTNVLAKKAVLANLSMASWGARRHENEISAEVLTKHQAETHRGLFTKRLLNKAALRNIKSIKKAARSYHNSRTQPWMEDGTRILPTALYLSYTQQMAKYKDDLVQAVAQFLKEYPGYIKEAKKELGDLFNEADYPEPGKIKDKFGLEVIIMPCPDKEDFRCTMEQGDMAEIKSDLEARINKQLQLAVKDVGERLQDVVEHMATKLKEYTPGPKKPSKGSKAHGSKAVGTFRDSLVENVKELAELLPAFNLDGDKQLGAIHKRVLKELCTHDAEALREDDNLRKLVAKSATEILKDVQDFIA